MYTFTKYLSRFSYRRTICVYTHFTWWFRRPQLHRLRSCCPWRLHQTPLYSRPAIYESWIWCDYTFVMCLSVRYQTEFGGVLLRCDTNRIYKSLGRPAARPPGRRARAGKRAGGVAGGCTRCSLEKLNFTLSARFSRLLTVLQIIRVFCLSRLKPEL